MTQRDDPQTEVEIEALKERVRALTGDAVITLVERLSASQARKQEHHSWTWKEPTIVLSVGAFLFSLFQFGVAELNHHFAAKLEEQRKTREQELAQKRFDWDKDLGQIKLQQDLAVQRELQRSTQRRFVSESFLAAKTVEDRARVASVLEVLAYGESGETDWYRSIVAQLKHLIEVDKKGLDRQLAKGADGQVTVSAAVATSALASIERIESGVANTTGGQRYVQLTQDGDCKVLIKWGEAIKKRDSKVDVTVFRQPNTLCAMTIGRYPDAEAWSKAREYATSADATSVFIKMQTGLPRASAMDGSGYAAKAWP
jgi:hypothetical protein